MSWRVKTSLPNFIKKLDIKCGKQHLTIERNHGRAQYVTIIYSSQLITANQNHRRGGCQGVPAFKTTLHSDINIATGTSNISGTVCRVLASSYSMCNSTFIDSLSVSRRKLYHENTSRAVCGWKTVCSGQAEYQEKQLTDIRGRPSIIPTYTIHTVRICHMEKGTGLELEGQRDTRLVLAKGRYPHPK